MALNAAENELRSETSSSDISGQEYVGVYSEPESLMLTRSTSESFSTSNLNEDYEVTESIHYDLIKLRIEGDGGSDGLETIMIQCRDGGYLKLDRSDGRPYVIKVYDNLPPTDRNNPEYPSWPDYLFNYTARKSVERGGFLEVSSLYVTLDADSSPKKLNFVPKQPDPDNPKGIIHRSCENIYCTLYFQYRGKVYELEPNENGVVTVEERNSVSECKTGYRIVATSS